jgi:DEAD/DEAH box helicase domain-containing protein
VIDHVCVDVEIQKEIEELPNGWDDTHLMGVSVAVVYEFKTDSYKIYGPKDVDHLKQRLLMADRVSGFNTWSFDFPVIWGLPARQRVRQLTITCDDLLRRIWIALGLNPDVFDGRTHGGWGLDPVAKATIGQSKTGDGAAAAKLYKAGEWAALIDYCVNDAKMERDLVAFVDRYQYVLNPAKRAKPLAIPPWQPGLLGDGT